MQRAKVFRVASRSSNEFCCWVAVDVLRVADSVLVVGELPRLLSVRVKYKSQSSIRDDVRYLLVLEISFSRKPFFNSEVSTSLAELCKAYLFVCGDRRPIFLRDLLCSAIKPVE